jgi:hypothetical protein
MEENTASSQRSNWPGAFGAYKPSKEAVRVSLSTIVLLYLCTILASTVIGALLQKVMVVNQLVAFVVSCYFSSALVLAVLSSVRGKRVELGEVLSKAPSYLLNFVLLTLLTLLTAVASVICLIIPAFFIIPRLALAQYYLIDHNMGPIEAYKASWNATRGNVGKVYGILGVTILMSLPILTVIGIIASVYLLLMYTAVTGLLYLYASSQAPAEEAITAEPVKTDS